MKYERLTKEQLEVLHLHFARFLATQQITAEEWRTIKTEKPHVAEEEIDIFSDLVWEKTLSEVKYLQRIDNQSVFCFLFEENNAQMISVQVSDTDVDLQTSEGILWLETNFQSESVTIFKAQKEFSENRNTEIFNLIKQGFEFSDGQIFKNLCCLIS